MEARQDEETVENQQNQDGTQVTSKHNANSSQGEKKLNSKQEKDKKKQERLAARQKKATELVKDPNDPSAHLFGEMEVNKSQSDPDQRYEKKYTDIQHLNEEHNGQEVNIRGRYHTSRATGKNCFIVIRERFATVQAIVSVSDSISKGMVKYAEKIPRESIIDVKARVSVPEKPVTHCSQKVELIIEEIWIVNRSVPQLPFQLEDASRKVENQEDEDKHPKEKEEESKDGKQAVVGQDTRLNNRIIDLRVPTNQALMKIQSGVCQLFREFLYKNDFTEIHSPKLIGGASEGGANVFKLKYFEQEACLAQSPQLYKQMVLSGDM